MLIRTAISEFIEHRRRRRRSTRTIEQYQYQLQQMWLTWCQAHQLAELDNLTVTDFTRYFDYLRQQHPNKRTGRPGLSPATVDCAWRVLRTFFNYCNRRKWLSTDQADFFSDDELIARPSLDERLRPVIDDDVLQALLNACTGFASEERARNRALLLVLAQTGARVNELTTMTIEKLRLNDKCGIVIGKGNREEYIYWHNSADRAIRQYLTLRDNDQAGPLFRRLTGAPMTADDVRRVLHELAMLAGVQLPKGAPVHSFRHRFAHKGIDSGLDISQVAQLMRHRTIATTMRYLRENRTRMQQIRSKMGEAE